MHAAPAVTVAVRRFGVWQAGVGAVVATGWAVVGFWVASHLAAQGGAAATPVLVLVVVVVMVAAAATLLSSVLAIGLLRVAPFELRWDGRCWCLGAVAGPSAGPGDPSPGELHLMIDLGFWLLLRFVPDGRGRVASRWLPVQRRGLESAWHGLRCAVHSPRPRDGKPGDVKPPQVAASTAPSE